MCATHAAMESRRRFLNGLLATVGGLTAAALTTAGCAAKDASDEGKPLPAAGATEIVPLAAGNYYANVMPDRIATARMRDLVTSRRDFGSKKTD